MSHTYTIRLHALEGFTVLPRLALIFSRRRLKIERLEMTDAGHQGLTRFTLVLQCDGGAAERLLKQIQRIVEVVDVAISKAEAQRPEESRPAVRKATAAMA